MQVLGARSELIKPLAPSHQDCCNLRMFFDQPSNFRYHAKKAFDWGWDKGYPVRAAIQAACPVVDLVVAIIVIVVFEWSLGIFMCRALREIIDRFASMPPQVTFIGDNRLEKLFQIKKLPDTVAHTIGPDDGTKRKHGQKAINQEVVDRRNKKEDLKNKKKSRQCGEYLLDFIGGTFGKEFLDTMINDVASFVLEKWVNCEAHVVCVLVDQASWEMKNWQVMTACIAIIYMPGLPHRWTNWNMRKRTKMTTLSRAIRSLMRGPKGKRASMGMMDDTKTRMLRDVRDPEKPQPKYKWKSHAIQEARAQGLPSTLEEILKARMALQSSVDKRWWRDWYTSRFLRKSRLKLAMVATEMEQVTAQEIEEQRLHLLPVEEGDLDLGEVSSDDEDDRVCAGDHVYLLGCLQPFLEDDKLMDIVDDLGGITHEVGALFEHLQATAPGTPLKREVAEALQKWTAKPFAAGEPCPSPFAVKLKLAQAKWHMNRKFIHNTMGTSGKYGKLGIQECLDQLSSEVSFAIFELMDPNLGFWETMHLTCVAKCNFVHRNPQPLQTVMESLSYEAGGFASAMAALHDAGHPASIKYYLRCFYQSSPYTEKEQETCHKERWTNNDRRCNVHGSNFSLQRDRLSQAVQRPAYVAPREGGALELVMDPDQVLAQVTEHAGSRDDWIRPLLMGMSLRDTNLVRALMRELKTWHSEHPNANNALRKSLVEKFRDSPPARNADALGFRAAELIARLELADPTMFDALRALSMSQAEELKINARLAAGDPVILASQSQAEIDVLVTAHDHGIFIGTLLNRVADPDIPNLSVEAMRARLGHAGECLGFPAVERGVHIVCGFLIDWDHYLARTRLSTNDLRKTLVLKQGHLVTTDGDQEQRRHFPSQSPAVQLMLMNEQRRDPRTQRKMTLDEFTYMNYEDRVRIYGKLVDAEVTWSTLLSCIQDRRKKELGFYAEAPFDFLVPEKKRKLNSGQPASRQSAERKEREEAGRYAARFVAEINMGDKVVAKMSSHRSDKGRGAEKLKMTWRDHVATTMGQSATRKWLKTVDPVEATKSTFFPLVATEFDCDVESLALTQILRRAKMYP
eukprot:g15696.t1